MRFTKIFISLLLIATCYSCSSEMINYGTPPVPSKEIYQGLFIVQQTEGVFVRELIKNTPLKKGPYKITLFPAALQLKSYYVHADEQGNIIVEYRLDRTFGNLEPIGDMHITSPARDKFLPVPVVFQ